MDHPGVPNNQMIKEDPILGARFEERSVAEQNSLALASSNILKMGMVDFVIIEHLSR